MSKNKQIYGKPEFLPHHSPSNLTCLNKLNITQIGSELIELIVAMHVCRDGRDDYTMIIVDSG